MSNRRYTHDYDTIPFPYKVKGDVADALAEGRDPVRIGEMLESHANSVRHGMDDPPTQFTIGPHNHNRLPWAVYDATGEEYLFSRLGDAIDFVTDGLEEDGGEEETDG